MKKNKKNFSKHHLLIAILLIIIYIYPHNEWEMGNTLRITQAIVFGTVCFSLVLYAADEPREQNIRELIVTSALQYQGTGYKRGGSSENGFDCSGFVRFIYKLHGMELPRQADVQFDHGRKIPIAEALPGDLIFFRIYRHRISHVGIYLGENRFIHAPSTGGRVRIDELRTTYWQNHFAGVVTYITKAQ